MLGKKKKRISIKSLLGIAVLLCVVWVMFFPVEAMPEKTASGSEYADGNSSSICAFPGASVVDPASPVDLQPANDTTTAKAKPKHVFLFISSPPNTNVPGFQKFYSVSGAS